LIATFNAVAKARIAPTTQARRKVSFDAMKIFVAPRPDVARIDALPPPP
jgi:hypothetical protein